MGHQVGEAFNQEELVVEDDFLCQRIDVFVIGRFGQVIIPGGILKVHFHRHIDFIPSTNSVFFLHDTVMRIEWLKPKRKRHDVVFVVFNCFPENVVIFYVFFPKMWCADRREGYEVFPIPIIKFF